MIILTLLLTSFHFFFSHPSSIQSFPLIIITSFSLHSITSQSGHMKYYSIWHSLYVLSTLWLARSLVTKWDKPYHTIWWSLPHPLLYCTSISEAEGGRWWLLNLFIACPWLARFQPFFTFLDKATHSPQPTYSYPPGQRGCIFIREIILHNYTIVFGPL